MTWCGLVDVAGGEFCERRENKREPQDLDVREMGEDMYEYTILGCCCLAFCIFGGSRMCRPPRIRIRTGGLLDCESLSLASSFPPGFWREHCYFGNYPMAVRCHCPEGEEDSAYLILAWLQPYIAAISFVS